MRSPTSSQSHAPCAPGTGTASAAAVTAVALTALAPGMAVGVIVATFVNCPPAWGSVPLIV